MKTARLILAALLLAVPGAHAEQTPASVAGEEAGFVPLFNGTDLSGWVPCNVAPETFCARDGMIVTSGHPVGTLRTAKMYENFVLEFEWRHLKPGGNSGLFLWADGLPVTGSAFSRGIEVQILDPGFIALQHHGSRKDGQWTSPPALVQFRNVFVRELKP